MILAPKAAERHVPLLMAACAFLLALALSRSYPLIDPDEGRNAEVAREMLASGDFVVPRLAGMPYLDKPPGFFWMAALAAGVAGTFPWAARLPAVFCGALTIWVLCRSAMRHEGPGFAARAGLLLLTAPLFAVLSAYVIFDMALTLCVTLVWTALWDEIARSPSRRGRLVMFAGVSAGLLIKGPVMLAWAMGGSVAGALLLRSVQPLKWLAWLPGWAMALGIAGGWFLLATSRYPEFPHYAFVEESWERVTTGSFNREQPLWFVPAVLAAGALPWSIATPWTRDIGAGSKLALGFILFAAVFFSVSRSKLVTYLLPAFPPLAWMAAEAWSGSVRRLRGAWGLAIVYALLAVGVVVAAARLGPIDSLQITASLRSVAPAVAAALAMTAALVTAAALRRRVAQAFVASVAFTPAVLLLGYPAIAQYAASQSGAPLARAIQTAAPGAEVRYDFTYSPGTDFLLGRTSSMVSVRGEETTSNYQVRYRHQLMARSEWLPLAAIPASDDAAVVVRRNRRDEGAPAGGVEFFRDARFVAYRIEGSR